MRQPLALQPGARKSLKHKNHASTEPAEFYLSLNMAVAFGFVNSFTGLAFVLLYPRIASPRYTLATCAIIVSLV